jgi:hypothetical protein
VVARRGTLLEWLFVDQNYKQPYRFSSRTKKTLHISWQEILATAATVPQLVFRIIHSNFFTISAECQP